MISLRLGTYVEALAWFLVAIVVFYGLGLFLSRYSPYTRSWIGPDADWLEPIRRRLLPVLDTLFATTIGGYAISRPCRVTERAGTVPLPVEATEELLWEAGFTRNWVASLKSSPTGEPTDGTWFYRTPRGPTWLPRWVREYLAPRQVHVRLYAPTRGAETDLYAHEEYSWMPGVTLSGTRYGGHPRLHYRGVDQDDRAGVERTRELLTDVLEEADE